MKKLPLLDMLLKEMLWQQLDCVRDMEVLDFGGARSFMPTRHGRSVCLRWSATYRRWTASGKSRFFTI